MAKKILVNGTETVSFTNFGAAEKVKKQNESISAEQAPAEKCRCLLCSLSMAGMWFIMAINETILGDEMRHILVVEDDVMLNSGLCYNLELDEYKAVPAHDTAAALEKIKGGTFDLIILDVNLPDGDGFGLCQKIKAIQDIPVVFLTARDLETDVMAGFDTGADDYITKPFNINILRKKVAAILKRSEKADKKLHICGDLVIDFDRLTVSVRDKPVILTPTEYKILKIFTSNSGILLTRQTLLEKLYDVDANFVDEHALTVNINRLRNKIESGDRKYIRTVYGMGYVWAGDRG